MSARAIVHNESMLAIAEQNRLQMQQRIDDLNAICPCNNDPFGNGPCEDCRDEMAEARRRRAIKLVS